MKSSKPSAVRYQVLAWLCLATVLAYVDRGCLAVAQEAVSAGLDLSKDAMGEIMGAFFLTYALFQLPTGWLGQTWGTRRAMPRFAAFWSAFTGATALAWGYPGLLASRLGMGAAEAGIFPCAASTLAKWFPASQRATVSGVLGSFMGIGGAIGAGLTGLLLVYIDWRWLFVVYAVPGFLWAAGFYLWFRDRPEDHPAVNTAELDLIRQGSPPPEAGTQEAPRETTPWGRILTSSAVWWVSAQQFLRAAGYVFYISWFPTYLKETRHVTMAEAGWLTSLPHAAQVLGALVGGVAADRILARTGSRRWSRQGISSTSLALCAGLILFSSLVADAWLAVLVITLGAFCATLAGPSAYAVTIDLGGRHVAAVFSVMNMAGNVGAVLFPIAVPRLVDATGSWDLPLVAFAGVHLLAAVCWLFVNPDATTGTPPSGEREGGATSSPGAS